MFGITVKRAAALCNGSLIGNEEALSKNPEIKRVVIDSRTCRKGDLFVAYRGENTDGHRYIASALNNGAACALAEYLPEGVEGPVICVEDVQQALEIIMSEFRKELSIPIIGITGSVGKTTAKEMAASVLSQHYKIHKTEGNLNNTIGLPMSVSGIEKDDELAVIEMGINHFGEMTHLAGIARPNIMLYTLIGHAHLEFLGDLQGVLRAKTEVLPFMPTDGTVVINGDDPMLRSMSCTQKLLSYGLGEDCDVRAVNISAGSSLGIDCDITYGSRMLRVYIPSFGMHMVYAALEGAALGFLMGLSDKEIVDGISGFRNVGRRQQLTDNGFLRIIDDCYNANPDSMKSSIDSLAKLEGRRICVFGDMRELGENSPCMHSDVGSYAEKKGIDYIFCTGQYSRYLAEGAGDIAFYFEDHESMMNALKDFLHAGDAVLVKASLGSHLEPVSEFLKNLKSEV